MKHIQANRSLNVMYLYEREPLGAGGKPLGPRKRQFQMNITGKPELEIDEFGVEIGDKMVQVTISKVSDSIYDVLAEGEDLPNEATLTEAIERKLAA